MVFLEECGQMKYTAQTDTAGTLALLLENFIFSVRRAWMPRLNPNPVFRTLSACGPPSGEMVEEGWWVGSGGVIHSAETLHFNPIYSHPQQKIITTLKPARRGEEKRPHSPKLCLWPLKSPPKARDGAGGVSRTQVRHCDKIIVCVANEAKWFCFLFFLLLVPSNAHWAAVEGIPGLLRSLIFTADVGEMYVFVCLK